MPDMALVAPSRAPRFHGEPPLGLSSGLLAGAGLPHLFTTRHLPGMAGGRGGDGPFGPEARALLAGHGLDGGDVAYLRQVHGAAVLAARAPGLAGTGDALLTDRPGLAVSVFTADCLPILLWDPRGRRLAAVHAGWRGTVASVTAAAVDALRAAGSRTADLLAAVGPAIGACCYEVDGPVTERLEATFPGRWQAWATPGRPGRFMLDLRAANRAQLLAAGLPAGQVEDVDLCTGCRTDLFFSYRKGAGRGRLAAVAAVPRTPC
jgi:hypothetical protein